MWHFTSKTCLASLQEDRQTLTAAYSCDYKYFASAGSNTTILVYDASTNQVLNTLEARWGKEGEQSWRVGAVGGERVWCKEEGCSAKRECGVKRKGRMGGERVWCEEEGCSGRRESVM